MCGGRFSKFSETLRSLELKNKVAPGLSGPMARNSLGLLVVDTSEDKRESWPSSAPEVRARQNFSLLEQSTLFVILYSEW